MDKVIFDTNAYRYLVTDKSWEDIEKIIIRLKSKEKANNIETLMSPIVAKELLAHVATRKDPYYEKCLKAIKAMYLHNGDKDQYSMIASPELLISKAFFNKTLQTNVETNKAIGQMLYQIAMNPSKYVFRRIQRNLNLNRKHVLESEDYFALQMKEFVKSVDVNAKGWRIFENDEKNRIKTLQYIRSEKSSIEIALGWLTIVYELLLSSGEISKMPFEDIYKMSKEFISIFPEPIALFKAVMENLVNSEYNLFENNRANFVWDTHLMFNVGNHTIADSKLYFVTSDKAIIKTAIGENAKYSILSYDEYIDYLI